MSQLQGALVAWQELYPEDSEEQACQKSYDLATEAVAAAVASQDQRGASNDEAPGVQSARQNRHVPTADSSLVKGLVAASFRELVTSIVSASPAGMDVDKVMALAQERGWRPEDHSAPRPYVCLTLSQLGRLGILTRIGKGVYAKR